MTYIKDMTRKELVDELLRAQKVASLAGPWRVEPDKLPHLSNIDYHVAVVPYKACAGGDNIIVFNYDDYHLPEKIANARKAGNKEMADTLAKNLDRFGIAIMDVTGHMIGDSIINNVLYTMLKMGIPYEFKIHGEVTAGLIEQMNTIYYNYIQPPYLEQKPYAPFCLPKFPTAARSGGLMQAIHCHSYSPTNSIYS